MLIGYFPGRHLGNKVFPAAGCGRRHQYVECPKIQGTEQKIVYQDWKGEDAV